ncbi:MAG: hypothetical protein HOY44_13215 [Maritimibacter sp.]|uniref:hypothetical protein n=1 Tax=Maritimibacter sp. TaxID=2003363 RepID=UPI001DB267DD|nr:hypothetical protein [Maritimibacter sp.]MBL6428482.1 hypothetical protein [Maritimibacter sp.]
MPFRLCALTTALAAALPLSANAACVAPGDLSRGIAFTREIKGQGSAQPNGQYLQVNYGRGDAVVARYGIFPVQGHFSDAPENVIGAWFEQTSKYSFGGNPPKPQSGRVWTSTLTVKATGSDQSGAFKENYRYTVRYVFEEMRQATLSGCTYAVMGVTARFQGEGRDWTDRYAYFPELGYGLLTQYTDNQTGRTARYGITKMVTK